MLKCFVHTAVPRWNNDYDDDYDDDDDDVDENVNAYSDELQQQ